MAFTVSNKAFEEAFNSNKEIKPQKTSKEIVDDFLRELKKYLKTQRKFPAAKAISKWMDKGGSLSSFTCRADMVEPMIAEFRYYNVPFVLVQEVTGAKGFLIRTKDSEKQRKIARKVLKQESHYCKVMSGDEVREAYLKSPEVDKQMFSIGNLSEQEMIYLENLCNKVLPGEAVGIDKMQDGTYLFTVHGKSSIMGKAKKTFASALAETQVLFNSNVKEEMREESNKIKAFRKAKSRGFPDKSGGMSHPVWIVGRENYFIKRNQRGYELGHAEILGDDVLLENDKRIFFDNEYYDKHLNSDLAKLTDKECLYSVKDVIEHFKEKKNYFRNVQRSGELHLVEEIDKVVSEKVKQDATFVRGNNWSVKFKHYQSEVGKVLLATKNGIVPKGYHKDQIMKLMNIAFTYDLDLEKTSLVIDKLRDMQIYDREVGRGKVKNIEMEIDRFRNRSRDIQPPTQEQTRGGDR